jgi:hypothetical protein
MSPVWLNEFRLNYCKFMYIFFDPIIAKPYQLTIIPKDHSGAKMLASNDMNLFDSELFIAAAQAEIDYIRRLGSKNDLMMAASNLGAYEALLIVLCSGADGVPVHHAIGQVQSRFSTPSCIIKRIGMMRQQGLILEKSGAKKS